MPPTVIAEACYLIDRYNGAEAEAVFLEDLAAGAYGLVAGLLPEDLGRMADLVRKYSNLPLGGTDASVITLAERVGTLDIATINHRHFTVVRNLRGEAFTLYPA